MAKKSALAKKAAPEIELKPLNISNDLGGGRLEVSLDQLGIGKANMRHSHVPDRALISSLQHHGQLHDLIVRSPVTAEPWTWEIVDGGRRYISAVAGVQCGALPENFLLKIRVDETAGKELSVAANLHMAAHPLDTCEAILELAKTEEDENAIATHFGQSVTWVKQRARLAELTDKAKEAYRAGRLDLEGAQLLTRLTPAQQDKLAKGKDRISNNEIVQTLRDSGVDCAVALFDWFNDYPGDKVQKSLFDDMVILLDRQLFKQHQEKAIDARIRALCDEGYNVQRLKPDDYSSIGKYVEFTGKVTAENKPSLHYVFKPQHDGLTWQILGPLIDRKQAEKIKAGKKGSADKTDTPPVALKATQMSAAQVEILNAHVYKQHRLAIASGKADEAAWQWQAITVLLTVATGHNGPDTRWEKLKTEYPGEFDEVVPHDDRAELDKITKVERFTDDAGEYAKFAKLPAKRRHEMLLQAVAASLFVPYGTLIKTVKKSLDQFGAKVPEPGEAFFKRYRTDQLLDYGKRSKMITDTHLASKKKGDLVKAVQHWGKKENGGFRWDFGLGGK